MPRYSKANVINVELLDNVPGLHTRPSIPLDKVYPHLTKDIKLDWDNDLVFDEKLMDYKTVSGLEALVQRLFLRFSVQKGKDHTDPNFGWDYEYIVDVTDIEAKQLLPILIRDFESAALEDQDVLEVKDIIATLERIDEQTSVIRISATIVPKKFPAQVRLEVELR